MEDTIHLIISSHNYYYMVVTVSEINYGKIKNNTSLPDDFTSHIVYRNFMLSLRSESTRRSYLFYLSKFLAYNPKYSRLKIDELLKVDHKDLEETITQNIKLLNIFLISDTNDSM